MISEADLPVPVVLAKFNDGSEYNRQLRGGAEDMFNYTGYPALLLFKEKKLKVAKKEHWKKKYRGRRWQFYGGGRDKPEDFVFYLSAVANGKDPFDEERHARPGFYKEGGKHQSKAIVDLEPDGDVGFNTTVLEDPDNAVWIVEFYSDRCPFCNSLAPEIIKAAKQVNQEKNGLVKFGAINSRVYDEVATAHEVTSWPWVAAFYQGKKVEDMTGLGGADSVVRFANDVHSKFWKSNPPPNNFLASEWASANQEPKSEVCSTEGPSESCGGDATTHDAAASDKAARKLLKEQALAKLESLLDRATKYNVETQENALKIWQTIKDTPKKKRLQAIQDAASSVEDKVAPITSLIEENKLLKAELTKLKAQ